MRILVTGAGGFVGRYLVRELAGHKHEVLAFDLRLQPPVDGAASGTVGDLQDPDVVRKVFKMSRPDACIHLGGIAFVPAGNADPASVLAVNTMGTLHVLEALREYAPAARLLVISTAQVYAPAPGGRLLDEDTPLRPVTLYAISKAAADLATLGYANKYKMHAMTARPNNHTGPGQSPDFVVPAFVKQVKALGARSRSATLRTGNLESRRDLADVRDVVRAYRLLIERGRAGQAYNISSQNMVAIGDVLKTLCKLAGVKPKIVMDPALYRPADESPAVDTSKLRRETGWTPRIPLERTLRDMLIEGRAT